MKVLENLTNVEPASAEFPFGDLKNNTGTNNGTPVNRDLLTDLIQFGQKMASEAGITMNDVPDNEYDGWQLYEAFRKLTRPYKVYTAQHNQLSTSAPTTAPVGFNDIGSIVWTRSTTGTYLGTLTGAFPEVKTILLLNPGEPVDAVGIRIDRVNDDIIQVRSYSGGALSDSVGGFNFEIRVYD
jgi:hypothetical protein